MNDDLEAFYASVDWATVEYDRLESQIVQAMDAMEQVSYFTKPDRRMWKR